MSGENDSDLSGAHLLSDLPHPHDSIEDGKKLSTAIDTIARLVSEKIELKKGLEKSKTDYIQLLYKYEKLRG